LRTFAPTFAPFAPTFAPFALKKIYDTNRHDMTNPHWLETTEYISLASATLGTIVATATQQVIYAALPLSISISLNLANRQRLYQLNQKQIETAIAQFQQRITELESIAGNSHRQISELNDTISQLQIPQQQLSQNNSVIQLPSQTLPETFSPPQPVATGKSYNWQCVNTITLNSAEITALAISSDGKIIASNAPDYSIKLWDTSTGAEKLTLKGHCDRILAITISPDGTIMASSSADKTIKLWDIKTERETGEYLITSLSDSDPPKPPLKRGTLNQLLTTETLNKFSPLNKGGWGGSPKLRINPKTIQGNLYYFLTIAFSPDGMTIATGSTDSTIKLWDVKTLHQKRILKGHREKVQTVAFSPDGETLASGSWDSTIKIWDISPNPQKDTITLNGHQGVVHSIAFNPDGKLLVSGSADCTIKLWDISTGEEIYTRIEHEGEVRAVAFSPDGAIIASESCDNSSIKLWHLHGDFTSTLSDYPAPVKSIIFNSDGQFLVSGSLNKTIKIWQYN
jgi:WD40 repeat protein